MKRVTMRELLALKAQRFRKENKIMLFLKLFAAFVFFSGAAYYLADHFLPALCKAILLLANQKGAKKC